MKTNRILFALAMLVAVNPCALAQEAPHVGSWPVSGTREPTWVDLLVREAEPQILRDDYAAALETLRPAIESPGNYPAQAVVRCFVGLGRYEQARRVIREHYPAWPDEPVGAYGSSLAGTRLELWAFVLAKSGECPRNVWDCLENGDGFRFLAGSVNGSLHKPEHLRALIPEGPDPRALEFMTSFRLSMSVGPRARERIVREALALWPEHPGARVRLAGLIAGRAGFKTEPDGTPARTDLGYVTTKEQADVNERYFNSLVMHITDDAAAREVLAHYRIALQNAPDDEHFKWDTRRLISYWEHWLGIGR